MKKTGIVLMLTFIMVSFSSCLSEQSKGEKLIKEHMYSTAYDYDSYEPIKTEVSKCNKTIWCNLQAISTAKEIVKEYKETYSSFNAYERNDIYNVHKLIKKHLSSFGEYETLEQNTYDGYSIQQKFRIKSRSGIAFIMNMKFIVDNDFKRIITSYETYEIDRISEGFVLGEVSTVFRATNN